MPNETFDFPSRSPSRHRSGRESVWRLKKLLSSVPTLAWIIIGSVATVASAGLLATILAFTMMRENPGHPPVSREVTKEKPFKSGIFEVVISGAGQGPGYILGSIGEVQSSNNLTLVSLSIKNLDTKPHYVHGFKGGAHIEVYCDGRRLQPSWPKDRNGMDGDVNSERLIEKGRMAWVEPGRTVSDICFLEETRKDAKRFDVYVKLAFDVDGNNEGGWCHFSDTGFWEKQKPKK